MLSGRSAENWKTGENRRLKGRKHEKITCSLVKGAKIGENGQRGTEEKPDASKAMKTGKPRKWTAENRPHGNRKKTGRKHRKIQQNAVRLGMVRTRDLSPTALKTCQLGFAFVTSLHTPKLYRH